MRALIGLILVVGLVWVVVTGNNDGNGGSDRTQRPTADEPNARITGEFIRWEPVDDARGYAYFSVTNAGPEDGVAECSVQVSNDFGNFGFDALVGEPIEVGEKLNLRMALDVGEGSFLIDEGEVTNC